jgi:hypothetical protein
MTNINIICPGIGFSISVGRRVFGMKRYFFHVASPRGMYMDDNGRYFSDLKGANAYAARVASELAQAPKYVGSSVCIVDEWGRELDRVSIGSGWVKVVRTD